MLPSIHHLLEDPDPAEGPQDPRSSSPHPTTRSSPTVISVTSTTLQAPSSTMPSTSYPPHYMDHDPRPDLTKGVKSHSRTMDYPQPHPHSKRYSPTFQDHSYRDPLSSERTRNVAKEDMFHHPSAHEPPSTTTSYNSPSRIPYSTEEWTHPRRDDAHDPSALSAPGWASRQAEQLNSQSSDPSQHASKSSSYRPQQQRVSPFDPSVASSSSSASPSPSIASATAASTPLTTEAITAVTNGTAAASISDPRSRFSHNQESSRASGADLRHSMAEHIVGAGGNNGGNRGGQASPPSGGLVGAAGPRWSSSTHSLDQSSRVAEDGRDLRYAPSNANYSYTPQPEYNSRLPPPSDSPPLPSRPYDAQSSHRDRYSHSAVSSPEHLQSRAPQHRPQSSQDHVPGREWPEQRRPPSQMYHSERRDERQYSPEPSHYRSQPRHHPSSPPHIVYQPHPSLQHEQQQQPVYDPVRESDQRPPHRSPHQPVSFSSPQERQGYPPRQNVAAVNTATSIPQEFSALRQQGSQKHGLATRSERMASPSPSHPYYTPSHSSRPSHSQADSDRVQHPRHESDRYASPPQPRPPYAANDRRPEHDQRYGRELHPSEHADTQDGPEGGSWSDGGGQMSDARAGLSRRTGHGASGSMPFAPPMMSTSTWKESQRSIRPSVSLSDLARVEPHSRRDRPMEQAERTEGYGEEEEDEEDLEDQLLDEGEDDPHVHQGGRIGHEGPLPLQQHPYPGPPSRTHPQDERAWAKDRGYEYEHEYESNAGARTGARYVDGPGPIRGQTSGLDPSHHHGSGAQYHGSPLPTHASHQRHPSHDYLSNSHGHPHHPPSHRGPQPYPPSVQHAQSSHPYQQQHHHAGHPHQVHVHPSQHHPPHHQRVPPQTAAPYQDNPMGSNGNRTTPARRGPYLSRQRALLAGLDSTSPSSRYQCQYCHKQFSRPSSLRIHTYSHTGERPFKCSEEGCGRQFSVQSNMRRHLRVHRMGRMRTDFGPHDQD
ncbi:hypothetical protein EMPS_08849 [Entomortierella parvispora]|uniref:C2H2-type domain-containing protein n=1 Tax=Entomortierella parvispora TaxID=205924 RepID=A0A9P3HH70_9FUNG|nr:hypothetical protein EMPS_08849 [Entomortierella parvispora]